MAEDQYFVFFLSLVMLVNGRDYVFQLAESPETLATELESLPSQLTTEDIGDMCELVRQLRHRVAQLPTCVSATCHLVRAV